MRGKYEPSEVAKQHMREDAVVGNVFVECRTELRDCDEKFVEHVRDGCGAHPPRLPALGRFWRVLGPRLCAGEVLTGSAW